MIIQGDCIEEMKKLPENSMDAIITDPPYGIGFMGKEWDNFKDVTFYGRTTKGYENKVGLRSNGSIVKGGINSPATVAGDYDRSYNGSKSYQKFCNLWSNEAIRVLKPGGFMLVSCSTRMYHRMACGVEDVGFEIRDTIMWLYGSGFPKSLNIGKQIDKIQGNEREDLGFQSTHINRPQTENWKKSNELMKHNKFKIEGVKTGGALQHITKGSSEYEGWGTALKPACELIVVARKPLSEKNVALNVLKWGTGGINIDECRIGYISEQDKERAIWGRDTKIQHSEQEYGFKPLGKNLLSSNQGRFPANIILDEEAGKMLDKQSGLTLSKGGQSFSKTSNIYGKYANDRTIEGCGFGDSGGASRFFYCPKASKSERNFGCEDFEPKLRANANKIMGDAGNFKTGSGNLRNSLLKNNHPTVKPISLIEYLIKLVTKERAIVLDPFFGSGTTAIACLKLNREFIGIEKESEYVKIAKARIKPFLNQKKLGVENAK